MPSVASAAVRSLRESRDRASHVYTVGPEGRPLEVRTETPFGRLKFGDRHNDHARSDMRGPRAACRTEDGFTGGAFFPWHSADV